MQGLTLFTDNGKPFSDVSTESLSEFSVLILYQVFEFCTWNVDGVFWKDPSAAPAIAHLGVCCGVVTLDHLVWFFCLYFCSFTTLCFRQVLSGPLPVFIWIPSLIPSHSSCKQPAPLPLENQPIKQHPDLTSLTQTI